MRWAYWAGGVLRGDLGESVRLQRPVSELIVEKLPVTLELACLAMLVALAIGVPMGVLSAVKRGQAADTIANGVALWGLSVPNFWLGILLILLFSVELGWLPASGYVSPFESLSENPAAMVMPAFVLGNAIAAVMMRHTRASMLGVLGSDYVRTARAKGVSPLRVTLRHALPNAAIPIITLGALEFGQLLSGAVLTEQVFSVRDDLEVDSAGLDHDADVSLSSEHLAWADLVFVMEKSHRRKLQSRFHSALKHAKVICLDIPDDYAFMDPELIEILEARVTPHLR